MALQLQLGLLKFEEIRAAIKNYFNEVRGIDYADGNNFSILVDALSYLQEMTSYQLSQQASNIYLRTSADRKTAVENAYKLGYVPHRKIPNRFLINGVYSTGGTDVVVYGERTGLPFTIYNADSTVAVQEVAKTVFFAGTGLPNQSFTIPTKNISNNIITVRLTSPSTEFKNFDIFDTIPNGSIAPGGTGNVFFLSEVDEFTVITFGNDVIGYAPGIDDTIEVKYFETAGAEGNAETKIRIANSVVNTEAGRDAESFESIVNNGAKYHSSRGRLITRNDYTNYYKTIGGKYVDVSENATGVNYYYAGNIYVSIVPETLITNQTALTDELKKTGSYDTRKLLNWKNENTVAFIGTMSGRTLNDSDADTKRIIGTNTITSSPTYMFCDITPTVESSMSGYNLPLDDLMRMRNDLMRYAITNIEGFSEDFRTDTLSREIFNKHDNIKSIDYNIEYSIITDIDNITDTYITTLPDNFVADNDDYYTLDNNFLGIYYEKSKQPIDRHTINGQLKSLKDVASGIKFDRFLYNGGQSIETENFKDALRFDFVNDIYDKQSFKIFLANSSYIIDVVGNRLVSTRTTGGDSVTTDIGYITTNPPGVVLNSFGGGNDIDWNRLINYSITKSFISTRDVKYRYELKMLSNSRSGNDVGREFITIDSKSLIGRLFVDEYEKLDITKKQIGSFVVETAADNNRQLNFKLGGEIRFHVSENSGKYTIKIVDALATVDFKIDGDELWASETKIDGTWVGEYDKESNRISYERILSSKNNAALTDFIDLRSYLVNFGIVEAGTKYRINIKPTYKISNNNLIYQQDFDHKSGLFRLFNINTLRNR